MMRAYLKICFTALFLLSAQTAFAHDITLTIAIPEDKARTWAMLPDIVEHCVAGVAFRGDVNSCLFLRNFLSEFSTKIKNELEAQAAQDKK